MLPFRVLKQESFQDGQKLGMVNGDNVMVEVKDGKITLNHTAHVIAAIPASNGIIYVVDAVMLPPVRKKLTQITSYSFVMKNNRMSNFGRMLTLLGALAIFSVLFFPLWQIQLTAPQYPEGLILLIYPGKLGGNVDIINGLNHYIGMKPLHAADFMEFTLLPYIIGFFSISC